MFPLFAGRTATRRPIERSGAPGIGVLSAIGSTPIIRLDRILPDATFRVYAKLEAMAEGARIASVALWG